MTPVRPTIPKHRLEVLDFTFDWTPALARDFKAGDLTIDDPIADTTAVCPQGEVAVSVETFAGVEQTMRLSAGVAGRALLLLTAITVGGQVLVEEIDVQVRG